MIYEIAHENKLMENYTDRKQSMWFESVTECGNNEARRKRRWQRDGAQRQTDAGGGSGGGKTTWRKQNQKIQGGDGRDNQWVALSRGRWQMFQTCTPRRH